MRSLASVLQRASDTAPDRRAYTLLADGLNESRSLTYGELHRLASGRARVLSQQAGRGDRVLLLHENSLDFLVDFLACVLAGVVPVPVPPPDTARLKRTLPRVQALVADCGAAAVMAAPQVRSRTQEAFAAVGDLARLPWINAEQSQAGEPFEAVEARPEEVAFLQYTSGSTSTPKGVMVSHANVLDNLARLQQGFAFTPESVVVMWMPYFHDYGLVEGLLDPLYTMAHCYLMSPVSFIKRPWRWLEAAARVRATHIHAPNFAYQLCIERAERVAADLDLSSILVAACAAEPVRHETAERFNAIFSRYGLKPNAFTPAYGLAEATVGVSIKQPGTPYRTAFLEPAELAAGKCFDVAPGYPRARAVVSCGVPIGGFPLAIVDPQTHAELGDNRIGEIWLSGPSVVAGYWNKPEETAASFGAFTAQGQGPWLRSGDLGFMRDGELYVTGRIKDLLIVNGANHHPHDIEASLEEQVAELRSGSVAVFALEEADGERVGVAAELSTREADTASVMARIREAIAREHGLPCAAVILLPKGNVLKTSSGKLQRQACRAAYLEGRYQPLALWRATPGKNDPGQAAGHDWEARLRELLADRSKIADAQVDAGESFSSYGLSSLEAAALAASIEEHLGRPIPVTAFWEYPNIRSLAAFLAGEKAPLAVANTPLANAGEAIAIVGMGCRFPGGADSPAAFWRALTAPSDAIVPPPSDRAPAAGRAIAAGFLDDIFRFDAEFFGIGDEEARALDPQQRLLLETAWHALEDAGIAPRSLAGSDAGVFIGASNVDYAHEVYGEAGGAGRYSATGTSAAILANRLSYFLDTHGPSLTIDTACSASLVAVHQACQALRAGDCGLALVGGANALLNAEITGVLDRAGMLSPSGRCRPFDASADGYVRGEGCGVVVLKTLAAARRDGDRVLALVRGSAVVQDGRSNGLSAPNGAAQREAVRRAVARAGIEAAAVEYVETHGTGTPLGDPIELHALAQSYGREGSAACRIGAAKGTIGHLEGAAGIAGLVAAVLALENEATPPLRLESPNARADISGTRIALPATLMPWPKRDSARLAAVSSFGFGGTLAHLILSDDPAGRALPRRAPLPLYPFAGRRYRIGQAARLPATYATRWVPAKMVSESNLEKLVSETFIVVVPPAREAGDDMAAAAMRGARLVIDALRQLASTGRKARCWVITENAVPVTPGDRIDLAGACAWGAGKAAALELPEIFGGMIDLPANAGKAGVDQALRAIASAGDEDQLALRDGQWFVPRLAAEVVDHAPKRLRDDAVYWIVGGTGALGRHVATTFLAHGAKHLVVTGRRAPQAPLPEGVRFIAADVTRRDECLRALAEIRAAGKPLAGIVHTAGTGHECAIATMSDADLDQVAGSKVAGAWNLHQATQGIALDFFACFSSIAALWGSAAQTHYAAGNHFLDMLCEQRRRDGLPALAIAWGPWSGGGLVSDEIRARLTRQGLDTIDPAAGTALLMRLLSYPQARIAAVDVRWDTFGAAYTSRRASPFLSALLPRDASAPRATARVLDPAEGPLEAARARVRAHVKALVAAQLGAGRDPDPERGFFELGLDSLAMVALRTRLADELGVALANADLFNYSSINALAERIMALARGTSKAGDSREFKGSEYLPHARADHQLGGKYSDPLNSRPVEGDAIAIVGLSCRFPGAPDPEAFWQLLETGSEARREIPADRWPWQRFYNSDPTVPGTHYVKHGCFLDQVADFDPDFFGLSGREADALDPQHRLLLEVSWEALERAGIDAQQLRHSQTGVFVGIGQNDYAQLRMFGGQPERISPYDGTGSSFCFSSARLSYVLGLHGPSLAVDTACSSSLVALHLAAQALRNHECDQALAGGVHLVISPEVTIYLSRIQALSPDGRSKAFSAEADGYGRGEGCGMLVLKREADARRDGDHILALLRGSAVNHDGPSSGLTVPSGLAQERLVREALARARIEPRDMDWIEAHGTGTILGDPIELTALANVFDKAERAGRPLLVSSVKTNIGHLEAASGIAGVIKVILAMQHGTVPPHLHFQRPNPAIDWAATPFQVPTTLTPWAKQGTRAAGVSSFGLGGTNAHIVLAEAAQGDTAPHTHSRLPLVLSAKSEAALEALKAGYAEIIKRGDASVEDLAAAAATRRSHFGVRVAVMDPATLLQARPIDTTGATPRVAFIFSGQGAQYIGMAAELYASVPAFRAELERCAALVEQEAGWSPLGMLTSKTPDPRIDRTEFTQPCLFTLQYALVCMWRAWGIEPQVVLAHSIGEFAAAWSAGVMSLEDAVRLVVRRGKLMQSMPGDCGMAALLTGEDEARAAIAPFDGALVIAAVNGPRAITIAGETRHLDNCLAALEARGIACKRLAVSHAFHSPQMRPMLAEFAAAVGDARLDKPAITLIATGNASLDGTAAAAASYWVEQVVNPVRFADAARAMAGERPTIVMEIGPGASHLGLARQSAAGLDAAWLAGSKPHEALAQLYLRGCDIRWQQVHPARTPVLALPTYPFQRRRCWVDSAADSSLKPRHWRDAAPASLPGERVDTPLGILHSARLSAAAPLLRDHRVRDAIVCPAASLIESALSVASEHLGSARIALEDIELRRPLLLVEGASRVVQTILTPGEDSCALRVCSRGDEDDAGQWTEHMTCRATRLLGESLPAPVDTDAPIAVTNADEFYAISAARGIDYGPAFRALTQLQSHAGGRGSASYALPPAAGSNHNLLHPVILDAALQSLASLRDATDAHTYVPAGIARLEFSASPPQSGYVHCGQHAPAAGGVATCSALIADAEGAIAVKLEDIRMRELPIDFGVAASSRTWLPAWEAVAAPSEPGRRGAWIVCGDDSDLALEVGEQLNAAGCSANAITTRAVTEIAGNRALAGICLISTRRSDEPVPLTEELALLQALAASRSGTKLVFATRGAQPAGSMEAAGAQHAPLWGLARVARNELSELQCACVDLDPVATLQDQAAALRGECLAGDEDQVAWRDGVRMALRLRRHTAAEPGNDASAHVTLHCGAIGDLETLAFAPVALAPPGPGEVRVRIRAAGLNFKDVLHAVGALGMGDSTGFGFDGAGVVEAVGPGVEKPSPGERVMFSLTPGSIGTAANVRVPFLCRMPERLSFAAGAGIPLPFLTAWHALVEVAKLKAGERVLIHAGAGGVGQAAIQVARALGALVYATASAPKQRLLLAQGVSAVYSSRSTHFAAATKADTAGRGMDVVLNCLTGELIPASLDCTARGGRFVEIGKAGIWSPDAVAAYRADIAYTAFDLADVARATPERIESMLAEIAARLTDGRFTPLPIRAFDAAEVTAAFRLASRARHVGKIVISMPAPARAASDGVHVVTGGFGALARSLCADLMAQGVRALALVARREPDDERRAFVANLQAQGAAATPYIADLGDAATTAQLLDDIERDFGQRIAGIHHTAGELADGTIAEQTPQSFARVMAGKLHGAWNLHHATQGRDLERFVLFSSAAALLGTPGQSNYAAANAGLDALAGWRRSQGLPALSVNWGPWAASGMAARLSEVDRARMSSAGITPLAEATAWNALRALDFGTAAQAMVIEADWSKFGARFAADARPSLFRGIDTGRAHPTKDASAAQPDVVAAIASAEPSTRRAALMRHLQIRVAAILGQPDPASVPPTRGFFTLGMDSLTSLELRTCLEKDLQRALPATLAFDYGSVELLADYLFSIVAEWATSAAAPADASPGKAADELSQLSEAELSQLLAQELARP